MREDWGYVKFDNYAKDMDALAETARAVIDKLMHEKRDVQRLLHAAVKAAGTIIISQDAFLDDDGLPAITISRDDCHRVWILRSDKTQSDNQEAV